jgi:uncharacterized 2Fe-2S/4Fe-4S cluster protein (DUF4445 family)
MPRVRFLPGGAECEISAGATLFDAGSKVSAGIETSCVGKGTCGLCRVRILAGEAHLNPFTDEERKHLGNVYHLTKVRLACRTLVLGGEVVVEPVLRRRRG